MSLTIESIEETPDASPNLENTQRPAPGAAAARPSARSASGGSRAGNENQRLIFGVSNSDLDQLRRNFPVAYDALVATDALLTDTQELHGMPSLSCILAFTSRES